jgi:hypothetical protein
LLAEPPTGRRFVLPQFQEAWLLLPKSYNNWRLRMKLTPDILRNHSWHSLPRITHDGKVNN